jgi:hypothetical protein
MEHISGSLKVDYLLRVLHGAANLIVIYLGYMFLVSIHEAGHYLAGRVCDFNISEFRVGILRWQKNSGWGFSWKWPDPLSGAVNGVPNQPDQWLRCRFLLFVLGGPVFNIFAGVAVLGPKDRSTLNGTLLLLSMASIVLGLLELLPMRKTGKRGSDGFQIVDAVFGGRHFRRFQFAAIAVDSVPTIRNLIHTKKWNELKTLSERLLASSRRIPQDQEIAEVVSDFTKVLGLANRKLANCSEQLEASPVKCDEVEQASAITA